MIEIPKIVRIVKIEFFYRSNVMHSFHVLTQMTFTFNSGCPLAQGKCLGPNWWALGLRCRVFKVIEQIERVFPRIAVRCNVAQGCIVSHALCGWCCIKVIGQIVGGGEGRLQSCPLPPSTAPPAQQCAHCPCALSKSSNIKKPKASATTTINHLRMHVALW